MTEKRKEEIKARSRAYHLEKYNCEGFCPDFEVGAEWADEHPESKYNLSDADYIVGNVSCVCSCTGCESVSEPDLVADLLQDCKNAGVS